MKRNGDPALGLSHPTIKPVAGAVPRHRDATGRLSAGAAPGGKSARFAAVSAEELGGGRQGRTARRALARLRGRLRRDCGGFCHAEPLSQPPPIVMNKTHRIQSVHASSSCTKLTSSATFEPCSSSAALLSRCANALPSGRRKSWLTPRLVTASLARLAAEDRGEGS